MIVPPTIMIGAATSNVADMSTSICTCCTSLVMRVISDGAPSRSTSWVEKPVTLVEQVATARRDRTPLRSWHPKYTAPTAKTTWITVTPNMTAPVRQM